MNDDLIIPEIEYSTYINCSPEKVFQSITTGQGWDGWFTNGTIVDLSASGKILLNWKDFGPSRQSLSDGGPILECIPNRKFVFQWNPASVPTTVSFSLEKMGQGTLLSVKETGYPATSDDLKALVECASGWGEALTLLKFYLEHGAVYGEVPEITSAES